MKAVDLTGPDYHHEPEDVQALQELASWLPPNPVIVNIGACFGTSSMAMLEARPDAFIFSIDVSPCEAERENLRQAGLEQRHRIFRILARSQEVAVNWPYKVDMVFVDGSHLYQDCYQDAVLWLPHIRPGGIIAFDDYGKPICALVKPAVDAAMAGYEPLLHRGDIIAFEV